MAPRLTDKSGYNALLVYTIKLNTGQVRKHCWVELFMKNIEIFNLKHLVTLDKSNVIHNSLLMYLYVHAWRNVFSA